MSPEVREIKLDEIETNAARQRAEVEYIDGFVKANEEALEALIEAFVPEGTDEELVPAMLYDKVIETFNELTNLYVAPFGATINYFTISKTAEVSEKTPAVKLGWAKYHPVHLSTPLEEIPETQKYPHVIDITPEGMQLIDGLRAAQGFITLREQRILNREKHRI